MNRQTKICIWVILLGLANFLVYVVLYAYINGEAVNGSVEIIDGQTHYFMNKGEEVTRGVFIYSGIHSISIWVTVAAVMLAMLTLAKENIVSSMRSAIVRGRTFFTILATIITLTTAVITILFILQFIRLARHPMPAAPASPPTVTHP
ncbi:MAG: hypothetical protein KAX78_09120 [Phycisphaerae bacterium]|nr:hypothetical protein [Phycisphaerae bacterium]